MTHLYPLWFYDILKVGGCQYKNAKIHEFAKMCHLGGIAMKGTNNPSALRSQEEITEALMTLL